MCRGEHSNIACGATSRELDLLRYGSPNQGCMVNANLKVIVKRRQCKRGVIEYLYSIIQC